MRNSTINQFASGHGKLKSFLAFAAILAPVILLSGCGISAGKNQTPIEIWDDMDRQPKYKTQAQSQFFSDGRASRRPVAGTVARGHLMEDEIFSTGKQGDMFVGRNPVPVTLELLERGQKGFNIYCAPCHDRTGSGRGIVAVRAQGWIPTNLHDERVRNMADGDIFEVIANGRRTMPSYRHQISERDRWAITAYLRALQRTDGTIEDVPADQRSELR